MAWPHYFGPLNPLDFKRYLDQEATGIPVLSIFGDRIRLLARGICLTPCIDLAALKTRLFGQAAPIALRQIKFAGQRTPLRQARNLPFQTFLMCPS